MSWISELKEASFRGAVFKVDIATVELGWNTKLDLIPPSSEGGVIAGLEGIGEKADGSGHMNPSVRVGDKLPQSFMIQAYFSGFDYMDKRDKFIKEIQAGGSGTLILPSFEPITVVVGKATFKYDNKVGGHEEVSVSFMQWTDNKQPELITGISQLYNDLFGEMEPTKSKFRQAFTLEGITEGAQWVADKSTDLTQAFSTDLLDTLKLGAVGDTVDAVTDAANTISQNAVTLIYTPTTLANSISDTIESLTSAFQNPLNAFEAQRQLINNYGDASAYLPEETLSEQAAKANEGAFLGLVKNTALVEMGRAAMLSAYATLEDALLAKSQFDAAARAQQIENGNTDGQEDSYLALSKLIGLVSQAIANQNNLPSSVALSFGGTNTSLSLAQDLYGNANRAGEIVERNEARNPLFLPTELEVLSF